MIAIHRLNPINRRSTNPADWSGDVIPGASDVAILTAARAADLADHPPLPLARAPRRR